MGPSPSHEVRPSYANVNTFAGDRESIFEVSPDEQAFCVEFKTPLFEKHKEDIVKPFNLPDENTIVDIMTDPVAFTQVSSPTEAWIDVVAPLFTGTDDNKPYIHQLLHSYFKFLKDRPNPFIDDENYHYHLSVEQRNAENQRIIAIHSKYKTAFFQVTKDLLSQITSAEFVMNKIILSYPNAASFPPHSSFKAVTKKVCSFISDSFSAYVAIRWGFLAGDITPIVVAFQYLSKNSTDSKTNFRFFFPQMGQLMANYPLENATFVPNNKKLSHTKIISFKMPTKPSRSMMACNGKLIYILGGGSLLTIISLSKFVNNNDIRFRNYDFKIKKKRRVNMFIASSNNYIVLGGKFLENEEIYYTQPFSKVEEEPTYSTSAFFRSAPKLVAPVACDGTYIYSLIQKKKLAVFSLSRDEITFHRYVYLKKGVQTLLEPFKHLVPKNWLDDATVFTNGVFFSFIVLKQADQNHFEYFLRNFSLVTGVHINDVSFNLQWPIQSIVFDPWNCCYWALSPTKDDVHLLKMPSYGSMPPWITGLRFDDFIRYDQRHLIDNFKNVKNALFMRNLLMLFFMFFGGHYAGSSFDASLTSSSAFYNVQFAQFFAPCSKLLIWTLIDLIVYFIEMYRSVAKRCPEWDDEHLDLGIELGFTLLQYNMSNMKKKKNKPLDDGLIDRILDAVAVVLEDEKLYLFTTVASFFLLTTADLLFSKRQNLLARFYYLIYNRNFREDYMHFAFQKIQSFNLLPYCISFQTCRLMINPIFERMVTKPLDMNSSQLEFVSTFQSSLMFEMRRIYKEFPTVLPENLTQLQQTFFLYSRIITERMISFLQIPQLTLLEKYIKFSTFFRLFRKWLMLLQPLSGFARVSQVLISCLHSLFTPFLNILKRFNLGLVSKDGKDFPYISKIFNELFSIYIDFISSLLNGGEELYDATQYLWLVRSTLDAKINSDIIAGMIVRITSAQAPLKERRKLLSKGISFNMSDDENQSKLIVDMIASAVLPDETESIKALFDFLYSKIKPNAMNKKLNREERHLERLIFLAFMKQLGFGNEVFELSLALLTNETPVLSHFVRLTMECVYRIRREIRSVKQNAIQNSKIEVYDNYVSNITNKCVFLIYIQPCLKYQQCDLDAAFPDFQKRIQTFILSQIDIDECFKLIEQAENARKHIAIGLQLINEILQSDVTTDLTTYMLDRLSHSETIMKYLSSLHFILMNSSSNSVAENMGFNNVMKLLDLLSKMIAEIPDESLSNTLIIFYSNLVLTIGKMNQESIFMPMQNLLNQLLVKRPTFSKQHYSAYIALITSCLYALLSETPQYSESTHFLELRNALFQGIELSESQLSIARLCLSAGMELPYNADTVISFLKQCSPSLYHPGFSLLLEIIRRSQHKKRIFKFILKEIAQICSGAMSSFLKDAPSLANSTRDTEIVKTPGISMGTCSDMIQICRRCLAADGECRQILLTIFDFILSRNSSDNDDQNPDFKIFKAPIYLFAIFAILSNVIDTFRNYSMIKDTSNNTIFYIKTIDQKNSRYIGWQLPITGRSIQKVINFSNDLIPISSMPFSPDQYQEYDNLIPYFVYSIDGRKTSNRDEALDFFVLSSLTTYLGDKDFLATFLNSLKKIRIGAITFNNSTKDFLSVLKIHLSESSVGFAMNQASCARLMHCSPAHISSNKRYKVTGNEVKCGKGTHVFISSVLSLKQPTYFEINFSPKSSFYFGVHSFSTNPSTSATYLCAYRYHIIIYNACIMLEFPINDKLQSLTVAFNPLTSKATFYDSTTMKKIHSITLPSNKACFILHTFDQATIKYHISHVPIQSSSINSENAQYLCPISGQTVFKRLRKKGASIKEALHVNTITSTPKVSFDSDVFTMNFVPMEEESPFQFAKKLNLSPFISYPLHLVRKCGTSLNTKLNKDLAKSLPEFQILRYHKVSNSSLSTPVPAYYESNALNKPLAFKFESPNDAVIINDNTGEVTPIDNEHIQAVSFLQPLHPDHYPILPTEILNLFATGFVAKIRHEVVNQIFIRAIATNIMDMKELMEKFGIDNMKLIEYSQMLMLYLEPVRIQLINEQISPIDFGLNILDPNQMAASSRYIHKTALNNIFNYFQSTSQVIDVIEMWLKYLTHLFNEPENHFVLKSHASAAVFFHGMKLPKTTIEGCNFYTRLVHIPGASSLLVFKAGFFRTTMPYCEISTMENKNGNPIQLSNNIYLVNGDSLLLTMTSSFENISIVVLPVFPSSNESLFGTFFQLGISFKYFINYLVQHIEEIENGQLIRIRVRLYTFFIDSYISESPFFFCFAQDVLKFLRTSLPTTGSDFGFREMPIRLSLLAIYADSKKYPFIGQFLEEQQMMWDERMLLPLKAFFPEFLTESDKKEISQLKSKSDKAWGLPSPPLPPSLPPPNENGDCSKLAGQLKRMMKPRTSVVGYPFHLLLHLWSQYTSLYPPIETRIINDTVCEITFIFYVPKTVDFLCGTLPPPRLRCSANKSMEPATDVSTNNEIPISGKRIYLELTPGNSWNGFPFALLSKQEQPPDNFIYKFRDRFVSDITRLILHWDVKDDEKILSCFPVNLFSDPEITLSIRPLYLLHSTFPLPIHLLSIRATLLFALNWILYFDKISFENDPSLKCLCQSMSMSLRIGRFRQLIEQQSNDDSNEIQINRREAYEVRTGASSNIKMTIISQLTRLYAEPRIFRRRGDKPWRVNLLGESGIDAGGPARELVSEAAADLVSPFCGLFIQVPNGRNDIGPNRDFMIPIADQRHTNALQQYKFAGVLIGICIRSSIVQDLNIAPLVWDYLASGVLTIEDIFQIDQNYKVMIDSLMEALKSDISEIDFQARFNLRFVIYDSKGQEVPLTLRGRLEKVTLANCSEFISLANEYRLGELRPNLEAMRSGLWENLDFKPPAFITGEMIEFSACGYKEITFESLKKIIKFENVSSEQQEFFLRVLQNLSSEQRSALLKFSTGRVRLPAQTSSDMFLRVDHSNGQKDRLPTASTCFNQFHMPQYSSYEKALQMITVAIEYTGTFENR